MASASEQFFITSMVEKLSASIEKLATQAAEANEAASKRSEEHHEAMRKHHEVIIEQLRETTLCFEYLNTKASVIELRQCTVMGEGTDAARMWAQWADGNNANPSPESLEKLRQSALTTLDSRGTSYRGIFGVKDMVRGESIAARFIEQALEGNATSPSSSEGDGNVGDILARLPLFRAEIMRAHDKKYLENNKAEIPTERFEACFPRLSTSDRALYELLLPVDKQRKPVEDPELDQGRHNARRTRCSAEAVHPFEEEAGLSAETLYERLDEKARKLFEKMPGLKYEADLRKRVTRGVVFWAEYYEHKYTAEQEAEEHKWEHNKKIEALKKNESSSSSKPRRASRGRSTR